MNPINPQIIQLQQLLPQKFSNEQINDIIWTIYHETETHFLFIEKMRALSSSEIILITKAVVAMETYEPAKALQEILFERNKWDDYLNTP